MTPQGVNECILTTKEFRNLSDTHTNREDKLQVKFKFYIGKSSTYA